MTCSVLRLWLRAWRFSAAALCVKEHLEGKEHKAITLARVGDGVYEHCRVPGDGRSLFCVYIARTVTQPPMQSRDDGERGVGGWKWDGKSTLGELTLVGAQ